MQSAINYVFVKTSRNDNDKPIVSIHKSEEAAYQAACRDVIDNFFPSKNFTKFKYAFHMGVSVYSMFLNYFFAGDFKNAIEEGEYYKYYHICKAQKLGE